jgi:hypothetical protein
MTNALIQLDNAATAMAELETLLASGNKILLLVLGDTTERRQLAADAVAHTEAGPDRQSFRYPVLIPFPDTVYPKLLELPTDNLELPPVFTGAGMFGMTIAMDGTICSIIAGTTDTDIALGFLLAETH